MELNQQLTNLICEIEYIIGKQCYNPNSYDGYTGNEGCSFRYPVSVYTDESKDKLVKIRNQVNSDKWNFYGTVTPELVRAMRYKFGSNNLYIGEAIYRVLEMMQTRYGLNFNEMEEKYQTRIREGAK